jgi:hypothetical protein
VHAHDKTHNIIAGIDAECSHAGLDMCDGASLEKRPPYAVGSYDPLLA